MRAHSTVWKRRLMATGFVGLAVTSTVTMAAAASFGTSLRVDGPQSLVVEVQSRACRACRNSCTRDYKFRCGFSDYCRTGFTRCMRECWQDICR